MYNSPTKLNSDQEKNGKYLKSGKCNVIRWTFNPKIYRSESSSTLVTIDLIAADLTTNIFCSDYYSKKEQKKWTRTIEIIYSKSQDIPMNILKKKKVSGTNSI